MNREKPVLGITMGDATGCGPEIIVKSLADASFYEMSRLFVIGDAKIMRRAVDIVGSALKVRTVDLVADAGKDAGVLDVLDFDNLPADLPFATVDARAGKAAYEYVAKGVEMAMAGQIDAIVTAPLNKEAMNLGGYHYAGHTEILGALSGTKDYAMMLVGGPLRVIHVSTHVSLREACNRTKQARVLKVIELADESCKLLGIAEPRVAVAGLNPHAGEAGMFGTEEIEEIIPAIEAAKARGICATGPIAPDTVFYRTALKGHFDIVVCMYHDQGHIPMKVLSFETGVNVTVGLPFIRTSVDHGTAFGKAGKGTADHRSLNESILLGAKMAETRRENLQKRGV
jgi:4-hydroxythreonine-4-phosphate dehydrogenase